MEEPLIEKTPPVKNSTKRLKKKSGLAKLVEKRKIALLSDAESEFGSGASIQRPNSHATTKQLEKVETVSKSETNGENVEFILCSTKDPSTIIVHRDKPRPKPRKRAKSSEQCKSDVDMDVDEGFDHDKKVTEDNLKGSQTDSTLHRLRNLRMATERSESVESLKSSPFIPKPPLTPRSSRGSSKGEKRIRDPSSSGEEADSHLKKSLFSTSPKKETNLVHNSGFILSSTSEKSQENSKKFFTSQKESTKKSCTAENTLDSFGTNNSAFTGTLGSISDLRVIAGEYKSILESDLSQSSILKEDDASHKPVKFLPPVTPNTRPPPLPNSFSSKVLRTAYKSDPMYSAKTVPNASECGTHSTIDNLSQRSFASTSVLQVITIKEARMRSYLNGNMSSASLLGSDELDRYFPDRRLHVFVGSWNMNEIKNAPPPESLNDFLLPESNDYVQDIYCIATQENGMSKSEWEIRLQETLGPSHVMFNSVTHGALHLAIFIRRDLIWYCSAPEEDSVSTRALTMVRTKGAVAMCFKFFGTSFLFINCHFTSDIDRKKERLNDYNKVIDGINLPKASGSSPGTSQSDVTSKFDCVYWCGDLNFRLERKKVAVEGMVSHIETQEFPNFETLLGGDQLSKMIVEDKIFQGFQEGRINFRPTYKFDVNTDTYDTSHKNRIPSYTDRILFRCKKKNTISCVHYDAVTSVKVSDHKPVFAVFQTVIKPGKDTFSLAPGHFDRAVYTEANKRRARNMMENRQLNTKHSALCSIQ
ncbi:phosphatidylinositol polyphosphate 5-phosphatase type IV-like [Gigantopelta aegis]|uniref:phosphatidylinositol polyphosphate 5-phosphatase type IV-like n=1 Tax=Gigantopelta aegis TaxID=1735272 RepID=UPI001B88D247|nr:phosphatidylinositol polyphosphate 5-phosphatase type IV-like [Gigantopelta aegis]XP_041371074.1 phosphatidylinositol polyphosphate 5-phosphatase type IV-like [Gigantopelta aegis]